MAFKKTKVGKVTWVEPSKGAFIEDISEGDVALQIKQSFSPTSQVFVPSELLENRILKEGQLIEYEEEDNVATKVEPLA